ncbi:hypothetical protein [Bacillus paramycoides]|uniref:hypothetical protein n=1 Tax=Bacillus paramycoides TaxID=2026194 RepID=UPI0038092CCE
MTTKLKRILTFTAFFILTFSFFTKMKIDDLKKSEEAIAAYKKNKDSDENLPELGQKVKKIFKEESNLIGVGGTYTYDNGSQITMLSVNNIKTEWSKDILTQVELKITNNSSVVNVISVPDILLYSTDGRYYATAEFFVGAGYMATAHPGETTIHKAYFKKLPRETDLGLVIKTIADNTTDEAIFAINMRNE